MGWDWLGKKIGRGKKTRSRVHKKNFYSIVIYKLVFLVVSETVVFCTPSFSPFPGVRGDISRDTDFSRDIFSLAEGLKEVSK